MGARIEALGTARGIGGAADSVGLAVEAARVALHSAGCAPSELELLIHTGVYRNPNIAEPAIAPLIQRRLGANPDPRRGDARRTFSFDLVDGSCGLLTAAHVAEAYLRTGAVRRALVLASDADPTPSVSSGWDFEPSAAALLLAPGGAAEGFSGFGFRSFGKHSHLFEGRVDWIGEGSSRRARPLRPNHALRVAADDRYLAQCAECAVLTLDAFLHERGLAAGEPDLLVPSLAPTGFPAAFAERLPDDPRVLVPANGPRPHSAGPGFALEAALERAREVGARSLVLVAAGAGITVGVALYRLAAGAARPPAGGRR
jgi:3-oxoacyl-[acyl-carrier-protein] synthase-3